MLTMAGPRPAVHLQAPVTLDAVPPFLTALRAALDGSGPCLVISHTNQTQNAVAPTVNSVREDIAVLVSTSGSTGSPKLVALSADQLTALTEYVNGSENPQWVSALPWSSMGGLNVAVRSLATDHPVHFIEPTHPFDPQSVNSALSSLHNPTFISLVPTQAARILHSPGGREALAGCARIFIGGAPVSTQVRELLQDMPVTYTYGMTETSGGCVFNGVPAPGVGLSINPEDSRISITGPTVATGYFPDTEFAGEFLTSDLGTVTDGHLTVIGRIDDIIIVKGTNVSLNAVAEALTAACHERAPASEVCVVCVDHPEDGAVICAAASGVSDAQLADAITAVRKRLGSAATPRKSRVMDALPQLPGGKIDRLSIVQLFEEQQ